MEQPGDLMTKGVRRRLSLPPRRRREIPRFLAHRGARKLRPFLCPACHTAATYFASGLLEEAYPMAGSRVIGCPQCGEFSLDAAFQLHHEGWGAVTSAQRKAIAVYLQATKTTPGQVREIDLQSWRAMAKQGEALARKARKP